MRIAIMGSGGVGGYFGAKLARAGYDVTFIARGTHLEAMRKNGLLVQSKLGDIRIEKPQATSDPASIGAVDLVLFGVKLWDTEAAARAIVPLVGPRTGVVSFQNGVQKDEALRAVLGEDAVMGGVCYIAATIAQPGVIQHGGAMQKLVFGEYGNKAPARTQFLLEACKKAGIDAEISADIRRATWEKFVFLVGLSATTATMRAPVGVVRSNPRARAMLLDAMREVVAVGRAEGVALAEDFAENRLAFCDSLPPEMNASMRNDLERGNRIEVEWLSGDVVARGGRLGVPTPVNRTVFDILGVHAQGSASA
ncbi:MAG TPA: 2-dehydropantoate 2-reductase [Burkholderiales bacterium]|nr:2-dehydropantoate 2-reductase [Burkholderiales bacterium]